MPLPSRKTNKSFLAGDMPETHLHDVHRHGPHAHVHEHETKPEGKVAAISVSHCTVTFGDQTVVNDVSFDIPQGDVVAILGPNGSGKTTLIKAILGLTSSSGEVRIFGKHLHAVRNLIAYVPQRFDFDREFPITVREFLDLARHEHTPRGRIREKIIEVGLDPEVLDVQIGKLSGGMLQRVLIAQALLNNPLVIFMDEPSSNIDIAGEATLQTILKKLSAREDVTVVLVSHDVAMVADLVDVIICVNGKMLCYGPPNVVLTKRGLEDLYGEKHAPFEHRGRAAPKGNHDQ